MDLTDFLTARLDEDERNAQEALAQWPDTHFTIDPGSLVIVRFHREHGPDRALREVAAGRKFLAWYADSVDAAELFREKLGTGTHMATAAESYLNAIRALAAVHSDHPDYDALWAPPE